MIARDHSRRFPTTRAQRPRGLAAFEELVRAYHSAFTNSKVEVLTQIAEGDLVATRWRITATNTGEYLNLAKPTNERITWTGVLIDHFEDGRIAETWVSWDKYRFFQGLGLVKT